jgi:hypothetical protein
MVADLLCSSKVVLPTVRESIWRKSLDQIFRNLYREKLIGIWKPVLFANVYQDFEKTKGGMIREVYDTSAQLACVPPPVGQLATFSR